MKQLIILSVSLFLLSCSEKQELMLADKQAGEETIKLYERIKSATRQGFLIGHQDATAYGVGWTYSEGKTSCDIELVCGDYPALYGWDLGHIEHQDEFNLDTVYFGTMRKLIRDSYERGGISTLSWHADNPVTGESSWTNKPTIKYILENDTVNQKFISWLDKVSEFLKSLKDDEGKPIPVIFRPWHEWNGSWFWWGSPQTSDQEFIALWKLTVETLRDKNQVHNVLYAFSPGNVKSREEFLSKYPGKDYVDILGFDIYVYNNDLDRYTRSLEENISIMKSIAAEGNKLFAVTETGFESIPSANWYTSTLYPVLKNSGISWVLFWRNANPKHHYAPYPGHPAAHDFKEFYNYPETLFGADIKNIP